MAGQKTDVRCSGRGVGDIAALLPRARICCLLASHLGSVDDLAGRRRAGPRVVLGTCSPIPDTQLRKPECKPDRVTVRELLSRPVFPFLSDPKEPSGKCGYSENPEA